MQIKIVIFLLIVSVILFFFAIDAYFSLATLFASIVSFFILLCSFRNKKDKIKFIVTLLCLLLFLFTIFILPAL